MSSRNAYFPSAKHVALVSLVGMLFVAVSLGYVLHRFSQGILEQIAEENNVTHARILSSIVWPSYGALVSRGAEASSRWLHDAPENIALKKDMLEIVRDTPVVKVKIYGLDTRLLFSSDMGQVGTLHESNEGVLSALRGVSVSSLTHRNTIDAFEKKLFGIDVLSSYVPVRVHGRVEAVFEIYSDVTPLVTSMVALRNAVALTVGATVLLLYVLLFVLSWRSRVIFDWQEQVFGHSLSRMKDTNQTLETCVAEQSAVLSKASDQLQGEVEERRRAEVNLRLAATVFEYTGEAVIITDRDQKVLAVNRAFTVITGFGADEVIGLTPGFLKSGRHDEAFFHDLMSSLDRFGTWAGEIWNRRKNGDLFPGWLSIAAVRDDQGELTNYVGVFSDITEVRHSQERLEFLAHHDPLTRLPNRVSLNACIAKAIASCEADERGFSILFIDLDHFKHVNDTLGHPLGDKLLVSVATMLQAQLGETSLVARMGGDEFVAVLAPDDDPSLAVDVARGLLIAMAKPYPVDEHEFYLGASIGIVRFPVDGDHADTLLARADIAMYYAKDQGRNSIQCYDVHMARHAHERLALSGVLRRAIEEDLLFLEFQPQIDIGSQRLVGVEALVRLRHPDLGVISPTRFIELAEEDGYIGALGLWVLRQSCLAMARWRAAGIPIPTVSVNVSVAQLERSELPDLLAGLLAENGLPPSSVEIEITESVIMTSDNVIDKLKHLREIGVSLAIDDFGTGYSSLSYLRKLPVQRIKIDRSFFVDVAQHHGASTIIQTIIEMARNLELEIIAEGVETVEQIDFLRREGCTIVQGFFCSHPLDEARLIEFVGEQGHVSMPFAGTKPLPSSNSYS